MTRPIYHHEKALVPRHLTAQTIETAPLDVPFYIEPGDEEDIDGPVIFVSPSDQLLMAKDEKIDRADAYPGEIMGKVAVMRVALINAANSSVRNAYVADLRFLGDGMLEKANLGDIDGETQGEFMQMADMLADTIRFDAFIAADEDTEFDPTDLRVPGAFFGNPELYPVLRQLRKRGNEVLAQLMGRELQSSNQAQPTRTAGEYSTVKPKERTPESDAIE